MREREDAVWMHVSFDLPVVSKRDRRAYREFLLGRGFAMAQFSIYVRYIRRHSDAVAEIKRIRGEVPPGGEIVVLTLSDHA